MSNVDWRPLPFPPTRRPYYPTADCQLPTSSRVQGNKSRLYGLTVVEFMFQLTKEKFDSLIFQIGTSSWGGTRKLPYAFTEQGEGMLLIFWVSHRKKQEKCCQIPDQVRDDVSI